VRRLWLEKRKRWHVDARRSAVNGDGASRHLRCFVRQGRDTSDRCSPTIHAPWQSSVKYPQRLVVWAFSGFDKYLPLQERVVDQLDFLRIERRLGA
jgi:hypothetical protein